jgi:hypothetical protein
MKKSVSGIPYSQLRSFRDITKHIGNKRQSRRRVMVESQDCSSSQTDETTELNYLVIPIPEDISYEEKIERFAFLADKIADVKGSNVICMAMWF